jgi:hypothetical protein
MKPTKKQMEKVEEVSVEEDGAFYYLKPGWRSRPGEHVHFILDAYNDEEYPDPSLCAREQFKSVTPCDCTECRRLVNA